MKRRLEIVEAHQAELAEKRDAAMLRALEHLDAEQRVPDALLDEIAHIEALWEGLATLRWMLEPRS